MMKTMSLRKDDISARFCTKSSPDDEAGFTLIEMLVTLALIALLSMVMIGGIVQMRSMSALSQRNDTNTQFEALGNYLDRVIANAKPLALIKDNPERLLVFDGAADHMRFISIVRTGSDQLNLREVELKVLVNGNASDLIQSSSPRRLSGSSISSNPVLIADVKSVTFKYLGRQLAASAIPSDWQTSWNEPGRLPRAVRITVAAERARQPMVLERTINLELAE